MLHLALSSAFPDLDFESECLLQDDGAGPYIARWNRPEPKPDESALLANFDADLYVNRQTWAAQAQARKERDARKALALPDSDDPAILKQKLNAALALLDVR